MYDYITKEGGWYLKNRRGEEIVAAAWTAVRGWTDDVIARNEGERAARAIREEAVSRFSEETMTFASFSARLARRAPFPDLRGWFDAALGEAAAANIMTVFRLMEHVIDFEINRPYVYWYGGPEEMVKFDREAYERIAADFTATRKLMAKPAYDRALDDVASEISAYREEIKTETAES
jgi:hypothetical protein